MTQLLSQLVKIKIVIERMFDLIWRNITGVPYFKYSQITPHLYLGGQYSLRALTHFKQLHITGVVNMRETYLPTPDSHPWMAVINLPTRDWTAPSIESLQKGCAFIETILKKGESVYIHCHQGLGRGPSMAVAYLMYTGMTYDDALKEVKKIRPFILINAEQEARLREFETVLRPK